MQSGPGPQVIRGPQPVRGPARSEPPAPPPSRAPSLWTGELLNPASCPASSGDSSFKELQRLGFGDWLRERRVSPSSLLKMAPWKESWRPRFRLAPALAVRRVAVKARSGEDRKTAKGPGACHSRQPAGLGSQLFRWSPDGSRGLQQVWIWGTPPTCDFQRRVMEAVGGSSK